MLPTSARIFLYNYLEVGVFGGSGEDDAFRECVRERALPIKYTRELGRALILLKEEKSMAVEEALYRFRLIPESDYRILRYARGQRRCIFHELAKHLRAERLVEGKLRAVLVYPIILTIELAVVIALGVFWFVPEIHVFFTKLNVQEPYIMRIVYRVYQFSLTTFTMERLPLFIGMASILCALYQFLKISWIKQSLDSLLLRLPIMGSLFRLRLSHDAVSKLALIAPSKKEKLADAVQIISRAIQNARFRKAFMDFADHIEKGGTIAQFWKKYPHRWLFPAELRQAFALGERGGDYSAAIKDLSGILSEELDIRIKTFIAILEPALIIGIAVFVAIFALLLQRALGEVQRALLLGS